MVYALQRVGSGDKANEVCRQLGVSKVTLYQWKKKYGGTGSGDWRISTPYPARHGIIPYQMRFDSRTA